MKNIFSAEIISGGNLDKRFIVTFGVSEISGVCFLNEV
jgi:hypothetical protein